MYHLIIADSGTAETYFKAIKMILFNETIESRNLTLIER